MAKVKVSTNWLDACAGCHMSLLDIDERIIELIKHVEFRSTPITDFKHPDEDGVDVGILTGAVSDSHQLEVAEEMRKRAKVLISMGDCSVFGGICTMRNFFDVEECLEYAYTKTPSTDSEGKVPRSPELAKLLPQVKALNQVVPVDIHIPGCPPTADTIWYALTELLAGRIPELKDDTLSYD